MIEHHHNYPGATLAAFISYIVLSFLGWISMNDAKGWISLISLILGLVAAVLSIIFLLLSIKEKRLSIREKKLNLSQQKNN